MRSAIAISLGSTPTARSTSTSAQLARERQKVELAACSRQRSLHDEPAALLAQTRGARRQLGAAAGEAREITVLSRDRDLASVTAWVPIEKETAHEQRHFERETDEE